MMGSVDFAVSSDRPCRNPKISIIIPVYNAQSYLRCCIDSILAQSFCDFEILLIDDGSSDRSGEICKKYASRDKRVRFYSQLNAGTSAARNTGLQHARGEYVTFVDNDDFWFSREALSSIVRTIDDTGADVVMHEAVLFDEVKGRYGKPRQKRGCGEAVNGLPKSETIAYLVKRRQLCSAVWVKVVRRRLIDRENLLFPVGMRNEDTYWTARVLIHGESVAWCDAVFYAYRKGHEYAQTAKPLAIEYVDNLAEICLRESVEIAEKCKSISERCACYSFLAYPYVVLMGQSSLFRAEERESYQFLARVKELDWILRYDDNPIVKCVRASEKVFGFDLTCSFLGWCLPR